jgi:hypothetical protein
MAKQRRLKCVRCSQPIIDDGFIISDQGMFHQRCWRIQETNERVRERKTRIRRTRDLAAKTAAILLRPAFGGTPICPVCLQPIKATEMVSGSGDDVMHQQCDYLLRSKPRS